MESKNCKDCVHVKEHRHFTYCSCSERKDLKLSKKFNYKETIVCKYYDLFRDID